MAAMLRSDTVNHGYIMEHHKYNSPRFYCGGCCVVVVVALAARDKGRMMDVDHDLPQHVLLLGWLL